MFHSYAEHVNDGAFSGDIDGLLLEDDILEEERFKTFHPATEEFLLDAVLAATQEDQRVGEITAPKKLARYGVRVSTIADIARPREAELNPARSNEVRRKIAESAYNTELVRFRIDPGTGERFAAISGARLFDFAGELYSRRRFVTERAKSYMPAYLGRRTNGYEALHSLMNFLDANLSPKQKNDVIFIEDKYPNTPPSQYGIKVAGLEKLLTSNREDGQPPVPGMSMEQQCLLEEVLAHTVAV